MKSLIYILVLTLFFTSCDDQKTESNVNISESSDNEYVLVDGTNISLIPPNDFAEGSNFVGLEGDEWTIQIVEVPQKFESLPKDSATLSSKGMKMVNEEELTVDGYQGELILVEQNINNTDYFRYLLHFGDQNTSVMITGTYSKEKSQLGEVIKKSMLSAKLYRGEQESSTQKDIGFTIQTAHTKLQYASMISSLQVYNVDGLSPTQSEDKTSLMVTTGANVFSQEQRLEFTLMNLEESMLNTAIDTNSIKKISINGLVGYEVTAFGYEDQPEDVQMGYIITLFNEANFFLFYGSAYDEFEQNKEIFYSIASTIKLNK